jgi:cell division protein FtsL
MKRFQTRHTLMAGVILISLCSSWAMFHVWTRHLSTELGYALSQELALQQQLASDNKALRLEISTLKSTERLETIAVNNLGMRTPQPGQVVYLWKKE